MNELQLKFFLSQPRFEVYLANSGYDYRKAFNLYKSNIELSESFYPILAILEICLRNSIHEQLKTYLNDSFWFQNYLPEEFQPYIKEAIKKIAQQRKSITADNIIAELNFGFWNRLFNWRYTAFLWKPLRLIFRNMPKDIRRRDTVSDALFRIRELRNRIYHYEPIFRNLASLEQQYNEMLEFLNWMDKDLIRLLDGVDRFKEILKKTKGI